MKRKQAIDTILGSISSNDIVVSTTGLITREIFEGFDSSRNIYVPGSMGLTSSIGLSLALCLPDRRGVVVDGDASLLMNMGAMVTIGNNCPKNLLHVVLDNEAYGSCSEEKSMSCTANLEKVAEDVGYLFIKMVDNSRDLQDSIFSFVEGPGFILVKIKLGGRRNFARPLKLVEIKKRFMKFLTTSQALQERREK